MKLGSLKRGGRDGTLIVVSRDLSIAVTAAGIAPTLQYALDHWDDTEPQLIRLYNDIADNNDTFPLDLNALAAPLPRAYQWLDGSAYVSHVELVRRARGADMPEQFWTDPLMYQGASDVLLGAHDAIEIADISWGVDFEAELAVITDDVAMGTEEASAEPHIKLITLVNDISLRNLIPSEIRKGFGFLQSKPATAFAPVAVTLDELQASWDGHRVHLPLVSELNGEPHGTPLAGTDMNFGFPRLLSHAAKTRHLSCGTIIGSGTVANRDRNRGTSCIAERRALEIIDHGVATTPFLQYGDRVRIEMRDVSGQSIFGAIDQRVTPYHPQPTGGSGL